MKPRLTPAEEAAERILMLAKQGKVKRKDMEASLYPEHIEKGLAHLRKQGKIKKEEKDEIEVNEPR